MERTTKSTRLWSEEATHWWTLLHGDGVTANDRREFLAWVSRSPERVEAYLGVTRVMSALQSGGVRWPDTPAEQLIGEAKASCEASSPALVSLWPAAVHAPARAAAAAGGVGLKRRFGWVLSAGVLAAVVLLALAWLLLPAVPPFYRTRPGEQRSILLADGSRVTLDSDSDLSVRFGKHRRNVRLLRGEALFQVSHDPQRPFDVYAGGAVVRAIGTEFNIDMRTAFTSVTVLQGRVAVMSASQASLPVPGASRALAEAPGPMSRPVLQRFPAPPGALILGVAERVLITPAGMGVPQRVSDLAATTAWTRQQLVFEQRPLEEVVDELNHYGGERIVIDSVRLRRRRVTGVIELDDPGSLLSFLSDVPGVVIRKVGEHSTIVTLSSHAPEAARRLPASPRPRPAAGN